MSTIFINNTVYASAGIHFDGDSSVLMLNNIAGSTVTGFNPITNCFNNIDRSGSLAATRGNIPNLALTFSDAGSDDYRLDQNDIWALGGGLQDNIQSYYYKDINNEVIEQWPIGAHATNPETRSMYFQAGSISDYMSGTPTISIVDGVATFSEAQTDSNVMIGSMISFTDMAEAVYITAKTSTTVWTVRTKLGYVPDDVTDKDVVSITSSDVSINEAFTPGSTTSLESFLGTSTFPFNDLTQIKLQVTVVYPNKSTAISVLYDINFATDEDHYLKLYTPYDTDTECNTRVRQVYGETPLTGIQLQNNGSDYIVSIYSPYTVIDGLKFSGGNDGIYILAENVQILGNLFYHTPGIVAIRTKEDIFRDSFINGIFEFYWDAEFSANYSGINNPAAEDGWFVSRGASGDDDLTSRAVLISGRFDIEAGLFVSGSGSILDTVDISASDDIVPPAPPSLFNVTLTADQIQWETETVAAISSAGACTYKVRMVRGGTLTASGVFIPDSNTDTIRCYYYDNWIGADTRATMTWIAFSTVITGTSQDVFFRLNGDGSNGPTGISYIALWSEENGPSSSTGSADDLIANNIINDYTTAIQSYGGSRIYNNTIRYTLGGFSNGIYNQLADDVKNNIIMGPSTCINNNVNAWNNTTSDASAGTDRNNQTLRTVQFEDVSNHDYHLLKGIYDSDECRGSAYIIGLSLPTDAQAVTRARLWDRGALEHIVVNTPFFSTGMTTANLSSLPTGTRFKILDSVITFVDASLNSIEQTGNIGKGDKIIFDTSDYFFISEKIDLSNWKVCTETGAPVTLIDETATHFLTSIKRAYTSLYNAISGTSNISTYIGGYDLVSLGIQPTIVQYYDNFIADTLPLNITGYTCDADHFLRIITPNSESDSNISHRHGDTFDVDKSRIAVTMLGAENAALYCNGMDYIELIGLQIDGSPSQNNCIGIETNDCESVFISQCIIRNTKGSSIKINSDIGDHVVVNNLIYDSGAYGIVFDGTEVITSGTTTTSSPPVPTWRFMAYAFNNTVVNCAHVGIQLLTNGLDNGGSAIFANNIIQDCGVCIDQSNDLMSVLDLRNNITDDRTAGGPIVYKSFPSKNITFIDKTNKVFIQSRITDYIALDHGYDLSDNIGYAYDIDISDRDRPEDLWDIGAYESSEFRATDNELSFEPLTITGGLTTYLAPGVTYSVILYLRVHLKAPEDIPINGIQFTSMNDLNEVASLNTTFDLLIYVEAGEIFEGNFVLGDRGTRTVTIMTDPGDYTSVQRPGVIRYASIVQTTTVAPTTVAPVTPSPTTAAPSVNTVAGPFIYNSIQGQLVIDGLIVVPKYPDDLLSELVLIDI